MTTACRHGLFAAAFTLAACHPDSTGVSPETLALAPLASMATEDAPRYSDWSAPVNLGAPVNTSFIDQGADISRDGLSLYYFCGNCPDTFGNAEDRKSTRLNSSHSSISYAVFCLKKKKKKKKNKKKYDRL